MSPGDAKARGRRIRQARRAADLLQTELAVRVGVHEVTVSNWERGEREPDLETIARIAAVVGRPDGWIAFGEDLDGCARPGEGGGASVARPAPPRVPGEPTRRGARRRAG